MKRTLLALFALILCSYNVTAQNKFSTVMNTLKDRISISAYAQAGFTYNSNQSPSNQFDLKRVSLTAVGQVTDKWTVLLMADFKAGKMQEFWTEYEFFPFLKVKFGQFKTAFSLGNFIAPTDVSLISGGAQSVRYLAGADGSDPMYGPNAGRDLGLLVSGRFWHGFFIYELGVMNGQGMNRSDRNSHKDFVGKLSFNVFDTLILSTSLIKGKGNSLVDNPEFGIAEKDNYRRDRWSMGINFFSPFFDLESEYLRGRDASIKSKGAYMVTNVHLTSKLDFIAAFDYFNKNRKIGDKQMDYVAGLQYWFYPQCRIQAQYVFSHSGLYKNNNSIQAQLQVAF